MQTAVIPSMNDPSSAPPHSSGPEGLGYSVWKFDGQSWQLKKNCAAEGAVLSPPPAIEGKFKGQLRSTACVAA